MRKFIPILSLFVAFIIANKANAQNKTAQLDSLFQILETNDQAMGSLAILKDDEIVYRNAIGFKNKADKVPASPNTLYKIGSITKTYTATLVMQLIEDDLLSLDDKLSEFYPQVTNADRISIEMLLRHRSGIFNFTTEENYLQRAEKPASKKEILKRIYTYKSVFEPDSKFSYSNTNYMLLTFIIEDLTKKSFQKVLKERIINHLRLKNTFYGFPNDKTLSYIPANPWKKEIDTDVSVPRGAGAIVATAADVARFYNALFNGKLVNEKSLAQMKTLEERSGIGLFQIPFYELKGFGHTGGIDGFQTNAVFFPEKQVSVVYLSNAVNYPLNDIMIKLLEIFFEKDFEYPDFSQIYKHTEAELNSFTGVYTSPQFPLDVEIKNKGGQLKGQATGQPEFPLRAIAENTFEFKKANLKIEFQPEENILKLTQMGQSFELTKETE